MLGTNGGGFFGMNSAHPFENPTGLSNFFDTLAMMLFPFALVLMYGRMLKRFRHGLVVFGVMLLMMAGTIVWSVHYDTLRPNPGLTAHPVARNYQIPSSKGPLAVALPAVAGLPVDQHLGNLEGKELRFGTSAGAAFAAITTDVTCGAVNAEADSLNPVAALSAHGRHVAELRVRGQGRGHDQHAPVRHPGHLHRRHDGGAHAGVPGRKIEAREVKLVVLAILVHPLMILMPTGLFSATSWGLKAVSNPGAHGFSQMLYQFSSASANNGSAFDGLGVTYGFAHSLTRC